MSEKKRDRELGVSSGITRRDFVSCVGIVAECNLVAEWPVGQSPCELGRQPFGRIHVANSDAVAYAYTNEAIDQAWRAVEEIAAQKSA